MVLFRPKRESMFFNLKMKKNIFIFFKKRNEMANNFTKLVQFHIDNTATKLIRANTMLYQV